MDQLSYLKRINNINAIINGILGVASLIGLVIMMVTSFRDGEAAIIGMMIGVTALTTVLVGLSVVLYVVTGKKVEQGRWRIVQTILAVLGVTNNPPLGTAYGVYALWVCWMHPESKARFEAGEPSAGATDGKAPKGFRITKAIMVVSGVFFTLLVIVIMGGMSWLLSWGAQEPEVTVTAEQIEIESMYLYDETIQRSQLTTVELRDELPTITLRTNGYALGGTLRGYFATQNMGTVMLYAHADTPPYIYMHTQEHWVILGFDDPARTRELFGQIGGVATPQIPVATPPVPAVLPTPVPATP